MDGQRITELVEFVKNHEALSAIFGERVAYLDFVNEQSDTALVVRDLTENTNEVKTESLVEFRVLAKPLDTDPVSVRGYLDAIRKAFEGNRVEVGDSRYYQVDALGDVFIALNDKRQYEGVTSLIFKITG